MQSAYIFIEGCSTSQFTCNNGQCVPLSSRCNNDGECNDGSDELDCGNVRKLLQMVEVCKQIILILKNLNTNKSSKNL